jgi:hypothetical protein
VVFRINRRARRDNKNWYISSMELEHANCTSFANPSVSEISKLGVFVDGVSGNRGAKASALASLVQVSSSFYPLFPLS